jgi:hypothetical protein
MERVRFTGRRHIHEPSPDGLVPTPRLDQTIVDGW